MVGAAGEGEVRLARSGMITCIARTKGGSMAHLTSACRLTACEREHVVLTGVCESNVAIGQRTTPHSHAHEWLAPCIQEHAPVTHQMETRAVGAASHLL